MVSFNQGVLETDDPQVIKAIKESGMLEPFHGAGGKIVYGDAPEPEEAPPVEREVEVEVDLGELDEVVPEEGEGSGEEEEDEQGQAG